MRKTSRPTKKSVGDIGNIDIVEKKLSMLDKNQKLKYKPQSRKYKHKHTLKPKLTPIPTPKPTHIPTPLPIRLPTSLRTPLYKPSPSPSPSKPKLKSRKNSKKSKRNSRRSDKVDQADQADKEKKPKRRFSTSQKLLMAAAVGAVGTGLYYKYMSVPKKMDEVEDYEENILNEALQKGDGEVAFVKHTNFPLRSAEFAKKNVNEQDKYVRTTDELYSIENVFLKKSKIPMTNLINSPDTDLKLQFDDRKNNTAATRLPTYFVANFQLKPLNGYYYSLVFCFKINLSTINNALGNGAEKDKLKNTQDFFGNYEANKQKLIMLIKLDSLNISSLGPLHLALTTRGHYKDKRIKVNSITTHFINKNNNTFEFDMSGEQLGIIFPESQEKIYIVNMSEYYEMGEKIKCKVGFVIEGETAAELPELLLGGTYITNIKLPKPTVADPETAIKNGKVLLEDIEKLIKPQTVSVSQSYIQNIKYLWKFMIERPNYLVSKDLDLDLYSDPNMTSENYKKLMEIQLLEPRTREDKKMFFMYSRYLYYLNKYEKITVDGVEQMGYRDSQPFYGVFYEPEDGKNLIARGVGFRNDKIHNLYNCNNTVEVKTKNLVKDNEDNEEKDNNKNKDKVFSAYRFGFPVSNVYGASAYKINYVVDVIKRMNLHQFVEKAQDPPLSLINIQYFEPEPELESEPEAKPGFFGRMMGGTKPKPKPVVFRPKKYICISLLTPCSSTMCRATKIMSEHLSDKTKFTLLESEIVSTENKQFYQLGHMFINFPLSKDSYGFYGQRESSLNPTKFEEIIDLSTPKDTFKSIVDIAYMYSSEYSKTHILCYHCTDGVNRTGIFDAVIQSTFNYIGSGYEDNNDKYEIIRKNVVYFMIQSYIISFYSNGVIGLDMTNIPVATYIFSGKEEPFYKYFTGYSKLLQ